MARPGSIALAVTRFRKEVVGEAETLAACAPLSIAFPDRRNVDVGYPTYSKHPADKKGRAGAGRGRCRTKVWGQRQEQDVRIYLLLSGTVIPASLKVRACVAVLCQHLYTYTKWNVAGTWYTSYIYMSKDYYEGMVQKNKNVFACFYRRRTMYV